MNETTSDAPKGATKYKLTISVVYAHGVRQSGRLLRSFVWTDKSDAEACRAALAKAKKPDGVTCEFYEFVEATPMA